jgi:hypothetical protein
VPEGQHSKQKRRVATSPPEGARQVAPVRLEHLILLGASGTDPVDIHSMTFADDGIGVIRYVGELPRILPWASVAAQVVEQWRGGAIPEWWVDPELNRGETSGPSGAVTDPSATSRPRLHAESGALIVIQTSTGIYRFIVPGGDPRDLSRRLSALAVRYQAPAAASTVTRVVAWGHDAERRKSRRPAEKPAAWTRIKPYLSVLLVIFVGTAIALILLQSAGTIHLPFLGGSSSGTISSLRIR